MDIFIGIFFGNSSICVPTNPFEGFLCIIGDILSAVVPILVMLGVVIFIWGVIRYVIASDEEAKKAGRDRIIFGLIGLAVIIGLWGLVAILINTFGIYAPAPLISPLTSVGVQPNYNPSCASAEGIGKFLCDIKVLLNGAIPLLILVGMAYFIWGVVRYVIADGEEAKQKGRDHMIFGLIGLAVIIGMWGLVNILVTTFDLDVAAPVLGDNLVIDTGSTCTLGDGATLRDAMCFFTNLINDSVIPLLFAVATVVFIWGAIKFFIFGAGEEAKREQGRQFMIWGIVALAVMLSIWGLVFLLTETFGFDNVLPQVCPPTGCPQ